MDFGELKRKFHKIRRRQRAFNHWSGQLERMQRVCLANARPVTEPVAWISQIQRSGGSLLSQLFDGHPQLHAHPHEIKIGYPKKHQWPVIDLTDRPERWFDILFEESVLRFIEEGYQKESGGRDSFAFVFLPSLQRDIFLRFAPPGSASVRDVLNAYMTSYFGAWLNNQNYAGPKSWVTGFTPRLFDDPEHAEHFFAAYPDGLLISVIRNPKNWFPSAFRHNRKIKKDKYGEIRSAMEQWTTSVDAAVRNKSRYGERVCILRFEDLIQNTATVIRHLAALLDIRFDDILMVPTFNRLPIQANTSFDRQAPGIITDTLTRHETLEDEDSEIIDAMTADVYQRALSQAVTW